MRRAYDGYPIHNDKGEIYAYNLGADFVAEHEWGVEDLYRLIGADKNKIGLEGRSGVKSVKLSDSVLSEKSKGVFYLTLDARTAWMQTQYPKDEIARLSTINYELSASTNEGVGAAWDQGSFGICVDVKTHPEFHQFLLKLENAIKEGDIAVWFSTFNAGLVVGITSMVPEDVRKLLLDSDNDVIRLWKASDATGIHALLKEKRKTYYACSPRWKGDRAASDTKFNVIYWLNPCEQDRHNFGWFTVEELTDWANGVVGNKIDMVKEKVI